MNDLNYSLHLRAVNVIDSGPAWLRDTFFVSEPLKCAVFIKSSIAYVSNQVRMQSSSMAYGYSAQSPVSDLNEEATEFCTQEHVDAYKWYGACPTIRDLR